MVRYIAWSRQVKSQYNSVTDYICQNRLHWSSPFTFESAVPFAHPADYKILRNDWPYGISPDITHLVVWLRTPVPVKEDDGDMTREARALIDAFVRKTFTDRLKDIYPDPEEHVIWFKNWTALQSVRALEHIHVMVRDVADEIVVEWTGEKSLKQDVS